MAEHLDPLNPFSSTKAERDFLVRALVVAHKSPALWNAIDTAGTEHERRARNKGRPYRAADPPSL